MSIGAISSNLRVFIGAQPPASDTTPVNRQTLHDNEANPAGPWTNLPAVSSPRLSFEAALTLQRLDEPAPPPPPSVADIFLVEARKSPIERMREQVLEELGLTEAQLAQLPPEERRAAEDKIRRMIEEKIRQAMGAEREAPESNAALLQDLA